MEVIETMDVEKAFFFFLISINKLIWIKIHKLTRNNLVKIFINFIKLQIKMKWHIYPIIIIIIIIIILFIYLFMEFFIKKKKEKENKEWNQPLYTAGVQMHFSCLNLSGYFLVSQYPIIIITNLF